MQESTQLFRHGKNGHIYAIRRRGDGDLVGSAGPLGAEDIADIEDIPVAPDNNQWIQDNSQDLILVHPLDIAPGDLSEIGSYINELTESLVEWDTRGFSAEAELPKLHETIQRLMDLSAGSDDEDMRVVLAVIELEARQCRKCILRRLGKGN